MNASPIAHACGLTIGSRISLRCLAATIWLDHIVCSFDMHSKVSSVHVIDKMPCSDHLPIVAAFDICNNLSKVQSRKVDKDHDVVRFNWYTADIVSKNTGTYRSNY